MKADEVQQSPVRSKKDSWLRYGAALLSVFLVVLLCGYAVVRTDVIRSSTQTIKRAEQYAAAGDAKAVRATLRRLLWFEPDNDNALLLWGASLNMEARYQEAIAVFSRVPERSQLHETAGLALASTLILDRQHERAENFLKRYLELHPHVDPARKKLEELYMQQMRKREAIGLMMDRWRSKPGDLRVLPAMLELETVESGPQGYALLLEEADKRHPNQAPVVLALAHADHLMGKVKSARFRFRSALELRPRHPDTRILAAAFFIEIGEIPAAEQLLLTEEESDQIQLRAQLTADDRYWFLRSRLALEARDFQAAEAHLEKALVIRPKEREYLSLKAELLRRLKRLDEAKQVSQDLAELARDKDRLLLLGSDLDFFRPTEAQCREIAELLERLGRSDQAAGWQIMVRNVRQANATGQLPPASAPGRTGTKKTAP